MRLTDLHTAPMPKRTRSHTLETLSEIAFDGLKPENWVTSRRTPDYGVDLDVEVFEGENATGIRFGVQLKSIDNAKHTPSIKIKESTLAYWLEHDTPVLLVFWENNGSTWYRWAHHIDHAGIKNGGIRVKFAPSEKWEDETPRSIEQEVRARRAFKDLADHLPIPIACRGKGTAWGVSAGILTQRVRKHLARFPATFALDTPAQVAGISISIESETTIINVRGTHPTYLHYSNTMDSPRDGEADEGHGIEAWDPIDQRAMAIVALSALCLRSTTALPKCAEVLSKLVGESAFLIHEGLYPATATLIRGGRLKDALRLIDFAIEVVGDIGPAILPVLEATRTPEDSRAVVKALRSWAKRAAREQDYSVAAPMTYTAANFARSTLADGSAVKLYERAARYDPSYKQRGYWWKEYGGALFLTGREREAANAYRQALRLGETGLTELLLADSLMFSGQYAEAQEIMDNTVDEDLPEHAEYRLKRNALSWIIETLGLDSQQREDANRGSAEVDESLANETAPQETEPQVDGSELLSREAAEEVLKGNALDIHALVSFANGLGDDPGKTEPLLLAAIAAGDNVILWLWAIASAMSEDSPLVEDICILANDVARAGIVDELSAVEEDWADEILVFLAEVPRIERDTAVTVRKTEFGSAQYQELR